MGVSLTGVEHFAEAAISNFKKPSGTLNDQRINISDSTVG
jgi:hypothetical protein